MQTPGFLAGGFVFLADFKTLFFKNKNLRCRFFQNEADRRISFIHNFCIINFKKNHPIY